MSGALAWRKRHASAPIREEKRMDIGLMHVDYPHEPGYLHDCPACESRCHCTPRSAPCVFDGYHIEWCRTCAEMTLEDNEGWNGECGACADRRAGALLDEACG